MAKDGLSVTVTTNFWGLEIVLIVVLVVVLVVLAYVLCSTYSKSDEVLCKTPLLFGCLVVLTIWYAVVHKFIDSKTHLAEKAVDALVELEKLKYENSSPENRETQSFEVKIQDVLCCKSEKSTSQKTSSSSGEKDSDEKKSNKKADVQKTSEKPK